MQFYVTLEMIFKCCAEALLIVFLLTLSGVDSQDGGDVPLEVITNSSPCSATCGLGMRSQTLCLLKDSKAAMEENTQGTKGPEVTEECRVRKVQCKESWQCGLRTRTVTVGQKLSIDCVEEVMKEMGPYAWRVSWRYARGVITSDDSLFARWKAPELDRVVLDPVQEKDAGTYRCDVQDASFRRVKRIYWGVRVLPAGVISLDQDSSVDQWESEKGGDHLNNTHTDFEVPITVLPFLTVAAPVLVFALYKWRSLRARCFKLCSALGRCKNQPPTAAIPQNDSRGQCETAEPTGAV